MKVRHTVNGARLPVDSKGRELHKFDLAGAFGLTPNVPEDFFAQWLKENENYPPVKQGLIFAHKSERDVKAQAKEFNDVRTGLEGLDPEKPAPGITRADKG